MLGEVYKLVAHPHDAAAFQNKTPKLTDGLNKTAAWGMASDVLRYLINRAPTRGMKAALDALQKRCRMGREIKAEQRDTTRNTIMFQCALAVCRSFKPEAPLLNILRGPGADRDTPLVPPFLENG